MNLVLDTHTFLWALFSDEKISTKARAVITDSRNVVYVSSVSFWEISLKYSLQKIKFLDVMPDELPDAAVDSGMDIFPVSVSDMASFHHLPNIGHKDPFDRMLIWQAIRNQLTMVSKDRSFMDYQPYGLQLVW